MPTQVIVPFDAEPRFPERCILCGEQRPSDRIAITRGVGYRGVLSPPIATRRLSVRAPVRDGCKWAFRRSAWFRNGVSGVLLGIAFTVSILITRGEPWSSRRLVSLVVLLVVWGPYHLWASRHPVAVDFGPGKKYGYVTFEFADPSYAREFESLNVSKGKKPDGI